MTQSEAKKSPTKQGGRKPSVSPLNGVPTPPGFEAHPERRHNGAWKKTDTLRYKWEQLLKLSEPELQKIVDDQTDKYSRAEQMTAEVLVSNEMKPAEKIAVLEKIATQIYGFPKTPIEKTEIQAPIPLSPRKKKAK